MKFWIVILTSLTTLQVNFASALDASLRNRIVVGCEAGMIRNNVAPPRNYKEICSCIGDEHFKSASNETNLAIGSENLLEAVNYYELNSSKRAQDFVDRNQTFAEIDFGIYEACEEISKNN